MPLAIADYALIGDCETAALVGRDGSIDWLCWPRFDSDACFAALLGEADHGRWKIAPADGKAKVSRQYRKDTLILETRFETDDGAVTLTDFMPLRGNNADLVRIVTGERGSVPMTMDFVLRFGYGATVPWVSRLEDGTLRAIAGPEMVVLRTPVQMHGEQFKTVADFTVNAGDTVPFVLSYCSSIAKIPKPIDPKRALANTHAFWKKWSGKWRSSGEWSDAVVRSLITLKALTYAPTGGIVAAPTTSLPEHPGGTRNWDYRYCWLRDASLTLLTFMNAGYYDEAVAWREWLLRAVAGWPDQMQIMYGIGGERRLSEFEVPWLPGYRGAKPVRVGNAAHGQLQLDVYGEVMDALYQARKGGLTRSAPLTDVAFALLDYLETAWREPDDGIWEVRSGRQHFVYSKVMAWVAFDRAVRGYEAFAKGEFLDRAHKWHPIRQQIHDDVCEKGFDPELNSFVRAYGSKELDASLLLLPAVGFLPADDPRMKGTVEAIENRLLVDGFVRRYDSGSVDDGLPPGEGVFLACSFWLADAYIMLGRFDEARKLFERLLSLRNDLGLLSEQYDPDGKQLLGNFPQAFSHLAMINTAFNLTRATKPAEDKGEFGVHKGEVRIKKREVDLAKTKLKSKLKSKNAPAKKPVVKPKSKKLKPKKTGD